ncbi:hypothetical protein PV797_20040 [Clostridiaceae bacterium M8S5]|nr:hypothetical protein PV797_20040 [Clostridiaceae bacterium M8S5]
MPKVQSANYFFINEKLGCLDSIIYNVKYYLILLVIHLSLLGIISLINVVIKKPILAVLGSISFMIVSGYLVKPLSDMFFQATDVAYYILGGIYSFSNILLLFLFNLYCLVISLFIWNNRIGEIV